MIRKDGTIALCADSPEELAAMIDSTRENVSVHSTQTHVVPITMYDTLGTPTGVEIHFYAFVYHYGPHPTRVVPGLKK